MQETGKSPYNMNITATKRLDFFVSIKGLIACGWDATKWYAP